MPHNLAWAIVSLPFFDDPADGHRRVAEVEIRPSLGIHAVSVRSPVPRGPFREGAKQSQACHNGSRSSGSGGGETARTNPSRRGRPPKPRERTHRARFIRWESDETNPFSARREPDMPGLSTRSGDPIHLDNPRGIPQAFRAASPLPKIERVQSVEKGQPLRSGWRRSCR